MYKPGGTIRDALLRIQKNEYVLPSLQREFVWTNPQKIERLFDSLMQGYPFGTFLLWKVEAETSSQFRFYDFVLNFHERDAKHCPELPILYSQAVYAVLDGQQRLSALNIGLRGSLALKQPHKRWNNSEAFPKRALYLNLLKDLTPDEEDGSRYEFKFHDEGLPLRAGSDLWFRVPDILGMQMGVSSLMRPLKGLGLTEDEQDRALQTLERLYQVVHTDPKIHVYEETAQDLPRVLNIFIRLNQGGTVLSYSDLLLSTAVAQWKKLDARAEIHRSVDELNRIGTGFEFTHDFVLKAGLMLCDIASVGFKVENFTPANMLKLEGQWDSIRTALLRTVELAASFGFNGQVLRADSALLPIAYYLYARKAPENYVTHLSYAGDRETIRTWLAASLLKPSGIWGSGLDTLLTSLRDVIQKSDKTSFPDAEIRKTMDIKGKTLTFSEAEIEDLLELEYKDRRTFPLLSLLFTFVDLRNLFHVDHIFPDSRFTASKLRAIAAWPEEQLEALRIQANQLPNLQLLEGTANNEKRAKLPAEWMQSRYGKQEDRDAYCLQHLLGQVPSQMKDVEAFWEARRALLEKRIRQVIKTTGAAAPQS